MQNHFETNGNTEPKPEGDTQVPLTDLIARIATNVTAPSIPKLNALLTEAETELRAKRAALDSLLVDGGNDEGPVATKAADAVEVAERRVRNLRSALAAAHARQATEQVEASRQSLRDHAQKTVALAEDRHNAIERLAKSVATFAADYNEVLRINSELITHLPTQHDSIAALTDRFALETALRKELVRLDLPWAFVWPYGKVSLPDLLPQFEGAMQVIRNLLSKDLQ